MTFDKPIVAIVGKQHLFFRLLQVFMLISLLSCSRQNEESTEPSTLFRLVSNEETGIDFNNKLAYTEELNPYTFRNFYNGGGVGLGDINNDGLVDIFFSGNLVPNKLYLNKGNFQFEDISIPSGIGSEGVWTTGVSMVDINSDGLLDIYICKSGPPGGVRHNELFINNGDLTFSERAEEYGIADEGLATHAAFFDFDKDGDLDMYLLNNSMRSVGGYDLRKDQRKIPDPDGGNKLYRNDGGRFTDVTLEAGIYSSAIGFGLGVTIGDIDKDGWPDIYVSNDFFEKDYLYINNRNGTFTERLEEFMTEISMGSMGADMADINNDGLPEIFVTEMLPEGDARLKTTTQFEKWDKYQVSLEQGYYRQFSRNTLQLNNGPDPTGKISFSDIARLTGVHATDWSWGALIFDMDNDGLKDIFVANGIYKDLLDQDYVNFIGDPAVVRQILSQKKNVMKQLIDSIPSNKVPNYAFRNEGELRFSDHSTAWGLGLLSHSNGSAYGDLDNDGDLDLVLNNVNMQATVFENRSEHFYPQHKSLVVSLKGEGTNNFALGSKVSVYLAGQELYQELAPMRGFMSSVDYRLHFGLGTASSADSVVVRWPDDRLTVVRNVTPGKPLVFDQKDASKATPAAKKASHPSIFSVLDTPKGLDFQHEENEFVDFDRDRLLFNMVSNEGPCVCVADVNSDGLDDVFIGGARGQSGSLYLQQKAGAFVPASAQVFEKDKNAEDTGCEFFDADGDGLPDLYVSSGSNEHSSSSSHLIDRLYFNKGKSRFEKSLQILPAKSRFESTKVVKAIDFDQDGDMDLFVGARVQPFLYGQPTSGYLLINDGKGNFEDETKSLAPELMNLGMITGAEWVDLNDDGLPDLVVVGEWMPLSVFMNENGRLVRKADDVSLDGSNGWYQTVVVADLNNDGHPDLITGNHGLNSRFKASVTEPISLYVNDFDQNGAVDHILTRFDGGKELPLVMRTDLLMQVPALKKKYLRFGNYAGQTISDIFSEEQLKNTLVLSAFDLTSSAWLNDGKGNFQRIELPIRAQFSPVYAIIAQDFDGDGNTDLLLGGNQHRAKPETGIYAASIGLLLKGNGDGTFVSLSSEASGVSISGEIRDLQGIQINGQSAIVIGKNNEGIDILRINQK